MQIIFIDICLDYHAQLVEFGHIHLLINYPPPAQLSKMVNSLKGISSRLLKKQFANITKSYFNKKSLCSPSYFATSCGGAPIGIICQYN
jgi:putative transposase